MRIAVVGAGPSGAYAAHRLAQLGHEVLIFDKFESREKACGGGVTFKALAAYPFISQSRLPRATISRLLLVDQYGRSAELALAEPLCIFSRRQLDSHILELARKSGALFRPSRVIGFERAGSGWRLHTHDGDFQADFLIGADGGSSQVRARLCGQLPAKDLSITQGYYLPGKHHQDLAVVRFMGRLSGYLWSFPRADHLSVGIIGELEPASSRQMRDALHRFIGELYPETELESKSFYSAVVPSLRAATWKRHKLCGENWALVGDAAGFADPITGEGIYYALRSAELLAEAFAAGQPARYERACRAELVSDFARAARWKERFGSWLYPAIARAALGSEYSKSLAQIENDFISGRLGYRQVRNKLLLKSPKILFELARRKRHQPALSGEESCRR